MVGFVGVTAIDTSVAAVTASVVAGLVTPPEVAVMFEVPIATAVARPRELIVATVVVAEVQVADAVRFCVLLSAYVPMAVNCWVRPLAIDGFAGVTATDTNGGRRTVRTVEPLIGPSVAVTLELPAATAVATPAVLMVATVVVVDVHVADAVRSCVLLFVYVPVAANCCVVPLPIDGFAGVTAIDTRAGVPTVRIVEPLVVPKVAVMVVCPAATLEAKPALLIVAVPATDEPHVTELVKFCVPPVL